MFIIKTDMILKIKLRMLNNFKTVHSKDLRNHHFNNNNHSNNNHHNLCRHHNNLILRIVNRIIIKME